MKRLILQVNIDPVINTHETSRTYHYKNDLYQLSERQAIKYANKCNSDYKQITDCSFLPNKHPIYQRLELFEYEDYDQILYLDSDAIVLNDCPNIFELYSDSEFCAPCDMDWSSSSEYTKKIKQKLLKLYHASENYNPFCSGVMLINKSFINKVRPLYMNYIDEYNTQHDQGILNRCVVELGENYTELSSDWGAWYRKGKYIIHLAAHAKKDFNLLKFTEKYKL
jgi:lipopolysaccharide biosynthesis glycosyltransferase